MSNPNRVRFWRSTEMLRTRTLGVLFFVVLALFLWTTTAIYNKKFVDTVNVDLITDTVGNALTRNADVKVRGVTVGEVRSSDFDGTKVTLALAIDPAKADKIPANVKARLLPKTLFGERYVDLVWPEDPSGQHLTEGMTLQQDTTGHAIEVSKLLDDILPLLQAVPPQYLASTLGAISQALQGKGEELGRTIDRLDEIFTKVNGEMPTLQEDLRLFADFSDIYADAAPQLVDALDNLRTTNATIVQKRSQIDTLYSVLTPSASELTDFLITNRDNIIDVAADSRPALEALARYSPGYTCALKNFATMKPRIDDIFGKGTDLPGSRVSVEIVNPRGRYVPNQDEPRWFDERGAMCIPEYPLFTDPGQYTNGSANDGSYQPPSRTPGDQHIGEMPSPQYKVYGPYPATTAGSPAEQRTLGTIYGAAHGVSPEEVPGWVSKIAAPAFRGSEVTIR
ncbi:MCE family protein [Nocardia sp. 2]|uniref:MCE family protein n=1 Tax=Nocardia acididurans TaxID=2802282 RepID=A0ABS1M4N3_9NOCA|nr:MCE family protein [Nocardia acididurans]MBL1075613.1 MCE family protein [Nocardia acididurans]